MIRKVRNKLKNNSGKKMAVTTENINESVMNVFDG